MNDPMSRTSEPNERVNSLKTYLRDHIAAAQQAIQLYRALEDRHSQTPLGQFAAQQLQQIEEDLAVLKNLAARMGAGDFQLKELAGWLGDKLSRLKLGSTRNPFQTFEALEFLSLGILGKRALWRALSVVASGNAVLIETDFSVLIQRAEAQYEAIEAMRLQVAVQAFAVEE